MSPTVPCSDLLACLAEHPPSDVDNETSLLEHGDEDVGCDGPLGRMLPPKQRLDPLQLHLVQIEDRVVEQEELASAEGGFQIGLEGEPLRGG